jgi:PrtD family type I secretion system ABC transporter
VSPLLRHCRSHLACAGLFSLAINLLQLTVPLYLLQVFDRVLSSRSHETLAALSVIALGALLVHLLLDQVRSRLLLAAGVTLDGVAGPAALQHALDGATGTALKDVSTLRGFLTGPGIVALFDAPWLPVYLGVLFMFHARLGAIAALGAALLLALAWLNERLTREPIGATHRASRIAAREVDAAVRHAEIVHVLGMADAVRQRWQRRNFDVVDAHVRAARRGNLLAALSRFMRLLVQVAMLASGALLVIDQQASAGVMTAATLILARALAPAEAAIATWRALIEAREAHHRLTRLPWPQADTPPAMALPAPQGRLVADGVSYTPPGASLQPQAALLKSVSFALDAGESLGIVGPSGSGKSTLARVLTGALRCDGGVVRLDGADIAHSSRQQLGPHLGYLPQNAQLLGGTVAQNIARWSDAASAAVVDAATQAQAHEMILQLPRGYETEVGEDGSALSGGQRQRVALARALFGRPRLVVLDEPNTGLDAAGEQALLRAMQQVRLSGATLIVITHRPSLLMQVDKLLVLDAGRVVQFGPRAEVMRRVAPRAESAAPTHPHLVAGVAR